MDPRQLFFDERLKHYCVYCGNHPSTRDHVPSRVLLDEPYPNNLPVVPACEKCNAGFSKDEQYVACLIECVLAGSSENGKLQREKIKRILFENPGLAIELSKSREANSAGNYLWRVENNRVQNIVLKLARGHAAYEFSEPQLAKPESIAFAPLPAMSDQQIRMFESPSQSTIWPEIGSRAFVHATKNSIDHIMNDWQIIQTGRYRYIVSQSIGITVRMVLSEYLACEVIWD